MKKFTSLRSLFKKLGLFSAALVLFTVAGAHAASASTVTRSFDSVTPVPGEVLTVTLTVDVTAPDTTAPNDFYIVDEVLPAGWTVMDPGPLGDLSQAGHIKWSVLSGAVSIVNQYTVTVPTDASGVSTFSGEFAFGSSIAPEPILGATSVEVQAAPAPAPVLTTIDITPITSTIAVGETLQLVATPLDQNGNVFSDPAMEIIWTSGDTAIADVDPVTGLVTGISEGLTNINMVASVATATGADVAIGVADITVNAPAPDPVPVPTPVLTTISIDPPAATLSVGGTVALSATPRDQNDDTFVGAVVTWSSSNASVATVNASGLVTGVSAGTATVMASAVSGLVTVTDSAAITVSAPAPDPVPDPAPDQTTVLTSVSVSPASASIDIAATRQLTASPLNQNGLTFAGASVTWSSSDTAVATVNASGLVTGVAAGSATVTASAVSGATTVTDTSAITVSAPASVSASAVTRSFSSSPVNAGSALTVTLTVSVASPDDTPPNDFYIVDEVFPAGWVIADAGTGDTTQAGHIKWAVLNGATSTVHQYTMTVPANASGASAFSGEFAFGSSVAPSSILGAASVEVQTDTTLSSAQPQAVITSAQTGLTTISVPADVTNGSLDLSALLVGSSTTLPGNVTIQVAMSAGDVRIEIPAGTTFTASGTWNGLLNLPMATTTSAGPTASAGNTLSIGETIEVGYGDTPITFNNPVKLTFVGQAGKLIGWAQAGSFHSIATTCDSLTAPTLAAGTDCKIDSGADLVVWTKHFSTFITYTETPIPAPAPAPVVSSGGGGGGGGGGGSISPIAVAPTTPSSVATTSGQTLGQVLGAATYRFSKSLSIGSRGDEVRTLQQFLIDSGYAIPVGATGYYGAQTRAAVIAFQKARGIAQAGVVGPLTRAELNKGRGSVSSGSSGSGKGSGLTAAQVSSIITVLQSFGVDEATLARVRSVLG